MAPLRMRKGIQGKARFEIVGGINQDVSGWNIALCEPCFADRHLDRAVQRAQSLGETSGLSGSRVGFCKLYLALKV